MKMRELFSDDSKWTQGAFARNKQGVEVDVGNPDAVCFCFQGAMRKCYGKNSYKIIDKLDNSRGMLFSITAWNDAKERTFEDIKNLVEKLDI